MGNYLFNRDIGATDEIGATSWLRALFGEGIINIRTLTSWQVTQRGAGANMSVDVAAGDGMINISAYLHVAYSDATNNVIVSASDATNPRIDTIVAYVDRSVQSHVSNNNPNALAFKSVTGTPAGSPTAPNAAAIQASVGAGNPYIVLANLAVAALSTTVVNANITDTRKTLSFAGKLYGGALNTAGHIIPNIADDTLALLAAAQTFTNKTAASSTNHFRAAGANSTLRDANDVQIDLTTQVTDQTFDYVISGIVITADNVGVNKNYSISSGFVSIGGRKLTVAAVSAQTVGASKDRYIDLRDNNDGTAVYITNEVANNAASQALTAGDMRVGIVVAGVTTIATTGSLNQGQENKVLPIASGTAYSKTDSLGNLICPRDPNRRVLGYRQIVATFTGSGSAAQLVTGLTCPVIVPTGRMVKITTQADIWGGTTNVFPAIYDTSVAGTELNQIQLTAATGGPVVALTTPAATSKTYVTGSAATAGTVSATAGATFPAFIMVELI